MDESGDSGEIEGVFVVLEEVMLDWVWDGGEMREGGKEYLFNESTDEIFARVKHLLLYQIPDIFLQFSISHDFISLFLIRTSKSRISHLIQK